MNQPCPGQCGGCALKPGGKANLEANNHLVAIFCAIGGVPFHCHEQLGWTHDVEDYPVAQRRIECAVENLMAAPALIHDSPDIPLSDLTATGIPAEIFAEDRALIGRTPICQGWRAAVADLAKQNWFSDRTRRKNIRGLVNEAIHLMKQFQAARGEDQRKELLAAMRVPTKKIAAELKRAKISTELFG